MSSSVILNWAAGVGLFAGFLTVTAGALTWWGNSVASQELRSSKEKEDKRWETSSKREEALLEAKTNIDPAKEEILKIHIENFQKDLERSSYNPDADKIIRSAKEMADTERQLKKAEIESIEGVKREFEKITLPILYVLLSAFKSSVDDLEKKGLISNKHYKDSIDAKWLFEVGGNLAQATISDDFQIFVHVSKPHLTQDSMGKRFATTITLLENNISITVNNKELRVIYWLQDDGVFFKSDSLANEEQRKKIVEEILKAVSKAITIQVKNAQLNNTKNR